jgi:hypothetical protein
MKAKYLSKVIENNKTLTLVRIGEKDFAVRSMRNNLQLQVEIHSRIKINFTNFGNKINYTHKIKM